MTMRLSLLEILELVLGMNKKGKQVNKKRVTRNKFLLITRYSLLVTLFLKHKLAVLIE